MIRRSDLILTLSAQGEAIRAQGVKSLMLIGLAEEDEVPPGQPIDFLVELQPPVDYDHWLAVRGYLADLLGRKVDLTIVDPGHEGVQPYLDPSAIFVYRSEM